MRGFIPIPHFKLWGGEIETSLRLGRFQGTLSYNYQNYNADDTGFEAEWWIAGEKRSRGRSSAWAISPPSIGEKEGYAAWQLQEMACAKNAFQKALQHAEPKSDTALKASHALTAIRQITDAAQN